MANIKISELTPKGANLASTDLLEISEDAGGGTYTTKSITGAEIIAAASGGGGITFGNYIFPTASGVAINPTSIPINSETNATGVANRCFTFPFIPSKTITISAIRLKVNTLMIGSNARILIFDNLINVPNNKIYESSNLDCSTTGLKTATTSQTFTAGTVYWLAVHYSSNQIIAGFTPTALINIKSSTASPIGCVYAYRTDQTFGSFPSTFGTPTEVVSGAVPGVQLIIA
jgi:hypothetical protein